MRLYVWRGATRNFGDELNDVLWPRLLPGLFDPDPVHAGPSEPGLSDPGPDGLGLGGAGPGRTGPGRTGLVDPAVVEPGRLADDASDLFLGIGSVLDARHPADRRKIVAGAGFGGYQAPASLDGSWEIYWVRGPRTARQLGLSASFGLGDPASLLPVVHPIAPHAIAGDAIGRCAPGPIGFMPHFESLSRGAWPQAAAAAGVMLIDPRNAPCTILDQIAGCRMLLSEALHGVIAADAMRVPWVALAPIAPVHRAKWLDWADALDLTIRFQALPASSPREYIETAFTPRRHAIRAGLARVAVLANRIDRRSVHLARAAASLRQAAAAEPQLSNSPTLARAQDRMLARLVTLRADHPARGGGVAWTGLPRDLFEGDAKGATRDGTRNDNLHDVGTCPLGDAQQLPLQSE
jgi:succinoglycan biosynthesis protein ExoV